MSGLEAEVVRVGQFALSAVVLRLKTYVNHVKNCEQNLSVLLDNLESLSVEKDDIDGRVLNGKEKLEKVTAKAARWLARVREFTKDETMKMLMLKDMEIAKVMLRLMKDDLKRLVVNDGEMRALVMKVMKNIAKRKRKASKGEISDVETKDNEVGQVLEKLVVETMEEFKKLMQDDMDMAVAALHLLENHTENLERLSEKDKEVADIIAKAREMSVEEELLNDDNLDNVLVNENTFRQKVSNLLNPIGELVMNEELLSALPENVRLGVETMGVVIGNRRGLKPELMDSDNATSHRRTSCCCVGFYNSISDRHDMSVAAEAMLVIIKDIIGSKPESQDVTRPVRRGEMEGIPTNCVGLGSRNELLRKIVKALASDDVHALGIFGMGGSGKTTLAREVINIKAIGIFETTVMVEISETPNIEYIQNQIADGLGLPLHDVHGVHEKAIRLYNKLKPEEESQGRKDDNAKKILIVLDNIWNKIDLAQMGIPREYCKLLLTSREREVCRAMDVRDANIFEVGLLKKDEAKDLFKFQVQKELIEEYSSVADRLLEKCGGLPLSIVATANSLKGKELPLWRQFAEELEKPISCQITGAHYETLSILRTSYEVMASEEKKKFFLLACLSPVGSSISVDNLMRYGIGLDLFEQVNKLSEAIELARKWADELMSSSMLLKGDSDEYVKIHDVVRESTMSFASKTGLNTDRQMFLVDAIPRWICNESFNKYTGISLLSQANYARLNGVKADSLQILLLKGNRNHSSFLDPGFFQGMTSLKVLEILSMNFEKGLPESMVRLKDLKTLHLVKCKLGDIKLIGELESLLVLSLHGSFLAELPNEIGKLYNLRLLDMSKCQFEQPRIPANLIARLSLLEGLYLINSHFTEWDATDSTSNDAVETNGLDVAELSELDFLNVLEICVPGPESLPTGSKFVRNLDKFQVLVGDDVERQPFQCALMVTDFDVSQEFKKDNCLNTLLKKAELLSIERATVKNFFPELDKYGFRDLSCLRLQNIYNMKRMWEGRAPTELFLNLRHLSVESSDELEELLPVNPLPHNLTTLAVSRCNSLTSIFGESGGSLPSIEESDTIVLPCLKTLKLERLISLVNMVKESNIDESRRQGFFSNKVKLPQLEELTMKSVERIVKLWSMESCMQSFQNLKVVKISNCNEMVTVGPPSMFHSLVQLESLEIESCEKMQQVISEENEIQEIPEEIITFPKLKCLQLISLQHFECFYGGSYAMKFPCLETMYLSRLDTVAKFGGRDDSTAFFNEKVEFPCLEKLTLVRLGNEATMSWDDVMAQKTAVNPLPKSNTLYAGPSITPRLRELEILNFGKLQWVFSGEPDQVVELPSLEKVEISDCFYMKSFSTRPVNAAKLREIWILQSANIEWFLLGNSTSCGAGSELLLPSLEVVRMYSCPKMKSFSPATVRAPKIKLVTDRQSPYAEYSKPCSSRSPWVTSSFPGLHGIPGKDTPR